MNAWWRDIPEVTHLIGRSQIDEYAELSGDHNPLHMDEEYARRGPFGGVIAHGPIAIQTVFEAVAAWLGEDRLPAGVTIDVSFRKPVRIDDEITCHSLDGALEHAGSVVLPVICANRQGEVVAQALLECPRHLVPREG